MLLYIILINKLSINEMRIYVGHRVLPQNLSKVIVSFDTKNLLVLTAHFGLDTLNYV